MQLGMVGLGRMGSNMARRLLAAGHECVVHDLDAAAADPTLGLGLERPGDTPKYRSTIERSGVTCYCMRMLGRRVHILLDDERHARLEAEAARTNLSVGALVRAAIDRAYPPREREREEAAARILHAPTIDVGDPDELRVELEGLRSGGR